MRIDGPTNPMHIARAYGVQPPAQVQPVSNVQQINPAAKPADGTQLSPSLMRLVAARVPGGIDFNAEQPQPTKTAIPFYRHPADQNAAAVSINAGRAIDVTG